MAQINSVGNEQTAADSVANMLFQQWLQSQSSTVDERGERTQAASGGPSSSVAGIAAGARPVALAQAIGPMGDTAVAAAHAAGIPPELVGAAMAPGLKRDHLGITRAASEAAGAMQLSQNQWRHILPDLSAQEQQAIAAIARKPAAQLNMNDPQHNTAAGAFALKKLLEKNGGDLLKTLRDYVHDVLGLNPNSPAGQNSLSTMAAALLALNELERRQASKPAPRPHYNGNGGSNGTGGNNGATGHPGGGGGNRGGDSGHGVRSAGSIESSGSSGGSNRVDSKTGTGSSAGSSTTQGASAVGGSSAVTAGSGPTPKGEVALPVGESMFNKDSAWNLVSAVRAPQNVTFNGDGSMTLALPKNSSNPGNGPDGGATWDFAPAGVHGAQQVTLSFTVKPSENFDFMRGGKLFGGIKIGEGAAAGHDFSKDGASYRTTWGPDGSVHLYVYNQLGGQRTDAYMDTLTRDGAYQSGDILFDGLYLKPGQPNEVSMTVTCSNKDPNSGAWSADGTLSLTVNGETRTVSGVVVPGPVNHLIATNFMGGQWHNPVDSSMTFSDVSYSAK